MCFKVAKSLGSEGVHDTEFSHNQQVYFLVQKSRDTKISVVVSPGILSHLAYVDHDAT